MGEAAVKVQDITENPDPSSMGDEGAQQPESAPAVEMSLDHCRERVSSFLDESKQKTLSLFTIAMAFADDHDGDENHVFIKFLQQVLSDNLDLVQVLQRLPRTER